MTPNSQLSSLDEWFDKVFVISLPTSTARRQSVEQEFKQMGIGRYELVNAIDGFTLDLDSLRANGTLLNEKLTAGEVGAYLSHIKVFQDSLERGYERVLVCEDDIVFSQNAKELFHNYLTRMPEDWDIIHFHSHIPFGSNGSTARNRQPLLPGIYRGYNEGGGTLCNAYSKRCLTYLLNRAFPFKGAIDGLTNWPTGWWTKGYKGYIVSPFPCRPGGFMNETERRGRMPSAEKQRFMVSLANHGIRRQKDLHTKFSL